MCEAVSNKPRPHLDCHVLGGGAGIDGGVVVHVVPGASWKVGLCGIGALVHNG